MRRVRLMATLPLLAAVIACGGGWREGRIILSGDEIHALFSGKTVQGYHEVWDYSFISFYDPSGTFRSYQGGDAKPRSGQWWVSDSGDICIRWEDEPQDLCRNMVTDDNGSYWKVMTRRGNRILVVSFESFVDGNVDNL